MANAQRPKWLQPELIASLERHSIASERLRALPILEDIQGVLVRPRDAMVASTGEHDNTRAVELFTRAHDALVESGQSLLAARVYDGGLLNAIVLLGRTGDIEAASSRALEEARPEQRDQKDAGDASVSAEPAKK